MCPASVETGTGQVAAAAQSVSQSVSQSVNPSAPTLHCIALPRLRLVSTPSLPPSLPPFLARKGEA